MVALRRRGRDRRSPADDGEIPFDLDAVAEAVLDAAEAELGSRPELAVAPEAALVGAGPDAFTFEVVTDEPAWSGTLVARASEPDVLQREAAWTRAAAARGFPVPLLLHTPADGEEGVLVFHPPAGTNLAGAMIDDFMSVPRFLAAFGKLHARLHGLPTEGLADVGDGEAPAAGRSNGVRGELARRAGSAAVLGAVEDEVAWLEAHRPAPGRTALCHGELTPVQVYVDGADTSTAVPVNWTRSRLAHPAYDVACTLTAFWSLPLYVDSAVQRTMVKLIRDSLGSAYLGAYTEAAGEAIEDDELRYWQAFHVCGLAVDAARRIEGAPVSPWDTAASLHDPAGALDDVRDRFWDLTRS